MQPVEILGFFELMGQGPMELFKNGGPIMWPIILVSFIGVTVSIERIIFVIREGMRRDPALVDKMIAQVEAGKYDDAVATGKQSSDFVVRIITDALAERELSFSEAFIRASHRELNRFSQGLPILDTVITAAPLLGLLGTVTGMMETFGALGEGADIAASASRITGGVGEALIATACGLLIAITGLLPFNYLNARLEAARHEIEDVSNALEIILKKDESAPAA
jgi:biopolymer transport protein ExbB